MRLVGKEIMTNALGCVGKQSFNKKDHSVPFMLMSFDKCCGIFNPKILLVCLVEFELLHSTVL